MRSDDTGVNGTRGFRLGFAGTWPLVLLLIGASVCAGQENAGRGQLADVTADDEADPAADAAGPAPLRIARLGTTDRVHRTGNLWLASQFAPEDLEAIRAAGIQRVLTLRTDGELVWDEQALVEGAGLAFVQIPFRDAADLGDAEFDRVRAVLENSGAPTLLHCSSSNRVGAVWLAWRVLDQGVPLETAVAESRIAGLRSEELLDKARRYIRRKQNARDLPDDETDEDGEGGTDPRPMAAVSAGGQPPATRRPCRAIGNCSFSS